MQVSDLVSDAFSTKVYLNHSCAQKFHGVSPGRLDEIKVVDPRKGALTQIFEEFRPQGVPLIIETVVEKVDSLVQPVRGTGWQTSHPGDRTVRQELRLILKDSGLPPAGELFDRAYAYIRENY